MDARLGQRIMADNAIGRSPLREQRILRTEARSIVFHLAPQRRIQLAAGAAGQYPLFRCFVEDHDATSRVAGSNRSATARAMGPARLMRLLGCAMLSVLTTRPAPAFCKAWKAPSAKIG